MSHDNDLQPEVVVPMDHKYEYITVYEQPNEGLKGMHDFVITEFLLVQEHILELLIHLISHQIGHEHNSFNEVVLIQMMDLLVSVVQEFTTDQNVVSMQIRM